MFKNKCYFWENNFHKPFLISSTISVTLSSESVKETFSLTEVLFVELLSSSEIKSIYYSVTSFLLYRLFLGSAC